MATGELRFLDPDGTTPPSGTTRDGGANTMFELRTKDQPGDLNDKAGDWIWNGSNYDNRRFVYRYVDLAPSGDIEVLQRSVFGAVPSVVSNNGAGFLTNNSAEGYSLHYKDGTGWVLAPFGSDGLAGGQIGIAIYTGVVPIVGQYINVRLRAVGTSPMTFSGSVWLNDDPDPGLVEIGSTASPFTLTYFAVEGPGRYADTPMRVDWVSFATDGDTAPILIAGALLTDPLLGSDSLNGTHTDTELGHSVTTDTAAGDIYAVLTTSATQPTPAQIKAGQDHTGAALPAGQVLSKLSVSASGAVDMGTFTGLTALTDYWSHTTHEEPAGTFSAVVTEAETTYAQQAVVVTQWVDVETGANWPGARTQYYKLWHATNYETTNAAAAEWGHPSGNAAPGVTDGNGILTIQTFALALGDPTFLHAYERDTGSFTPDSPQGVSREDSVVNGLINRAGIADYVEAPEQTGNWIPTEIYVSEKDRMRRNWELITWIVGSHVEGFRLISHADPLPGATLNPSRWVIKRGNVSVMIQSITRIDSNTIYINIPDNVFRPGNLAFVRWRGWHAPTARPSIGRVFRIPER